MRFRTFKISFSFLASLYCVSIFWGQSVYWSPSDGTLQQGKANTLDLFYDSCEPDGDPDFPAVDGLALNFRGRSNSRTIINGRLSAKTIFNYQAIPSKMGAISIPEFRVKTSKGELTVPSARFEVVAATVGNSGVSPDEVFVSLFQTRDSNIYEGEVFELEYLAGAKQEYQLADLSVPVWNPTTLVTGGLADRQVTGVNYQGAQYLVKVYAAKAMATESGIVQVPGASQDATVVIGRKRDFMFQEPVYDSFTIQSDPFALEIKPLPEGAPASFSGAVGTFALESRVVPEEVQVGEPVTWTLELDGSGNWPAGIGVPPRSVSSRFKAIQPEIKNEFEENDLFTGKQTEDIVLIPTQEGTFEFGPLTYTYFDPIEEAYKTIEIPAKTVTVVPVAPGNPALSSNIGGGNTDQLASGSDSSDQRSYSLDPTGENVFSKQPEMIKDPRSGSQAFLTPVANQPMLKPTLIALACPLGFWLLLAFFRSAATDPLKPERNALSDLRKVSRSTLPSDPKDLKAMHLKWREAAARYFGLAAVEPTPDEISNAANDIRGETFAANWKKAWLLSDKTLFGSGDSDQTEWQSLVRETCEACPGKRFSPSRVFRYKAWIPSLILAILFTANVNDGSAQEQKSEASELYDQGKFAAASARWTDQINMAPNEFESRYNAGIAAAQLGDWPRAWGLWTSAFCLDPSNKDVAWNLRIAHQNTTAYDPVLQSLIEGEDLYSIIRLRSPAQWQQLSTQSLWALGILLCLVILTLYLKPFRKLTAPFLFVSLLAGLLSYFSIWSHSKYEALGKPDTLLIVQETSLLSIPTDLQPDQVSSAVAVGSIVEIEKTFLGWVKVSLPNGESGWLRKESIMPLYGPLVQI